MRDLKGAEKSEAVAFVGRHAGDIDSVEQHAAGSGRIGSGNNVEEGGLARSIGSDQTGYCACFDFQ